MLIVTALNSGVERWCKVGQVGLEHMHRTYMHDAQREGPASAEPSQDPFPPRERVFTVDRARR